MPDAPTPLDLDAIRAAVADLDTAFDAPDDGRTLVTEHPTLALLAHVAAQVPALLAEVERLRAEVAVARQHQREASLAIRSVEGLRKERDDALAEIARLTARPAPAWDEEAVVEAVARDLFQSTYPGSTSWDTLPADEFGKELWRESANGLLAVVREHLPVKPDRETVAQAIFEAGAAGAAVEFGLDGPVPWSSLDADDVERMCAQADAVLALLPGRSEAEVKAEALRDAAERIGPWTLASEVRQQLLDGADRLAAEGGAS